jgi:hypothetical protein
MMMHGLANVKFDGKLGLEKIKNIHMNECHLSEFSYIQYCVFNSNKLTNQM